MRRKREATKATSPPTDAPAQRHRSFVGSGRVDRINADRPRGGIQNSRDLHLLVEEVVRLLLVVKLIGRVVSTGKNELAAGFHNSSLECDSRISSTVVIVAVVGIRLRRLYRL